MTRVLCILVLSALALIPLRAAAQDPWFEVETLNPGLPPAPEALDRDTPMGAMESFLSLTGAGHHSAAAHLLDLSNIPRADQATRGRALAEALSVVIERKVVVPWGNLPDRPDGWLSGRSENDDTGRVRRSILVDSFELDGRRVPLRLNRVQPPDGDPVWVFSRQSVDNIPRLLDLYGPTELEQSLPGWARSKSFFGMYLWEVLLVPVLLVVAIAGGVITSRVFRRLGRKAKRRNVRFVSRSLRWPAAIAVFAAVIGGGLRHLLSVSGLLDAILSPVLVIAYVTSITLALVMIIDEIFDRISPSDPTELADPANSHLRALSTTMSAARKAVIVIALLVAIGVVLASVNTFQTIGFSLLASAGALTIVLGFAAREVLGNILASVQIALNRSARIGDQLVFEGQYCTVERIHFTYVQLMIWNGTRLVVPVSSFVKDAFENWSMEDTDMVRPIELTLAQGVDLDPLRRFFLDRVAQETDEDVAPKDRACVYVTEQDVFGTKVRFDLPTANPSTGWDIQCAVREDILAEARRLEAASGKPVLPRPPGDLPDG